MLPTWLDESESKFMALLAATIRVVLKASVVGFVGSSDRADLCLANMTDGDQCNVPWRNPVEDSSEADDILVTAVLPCLMLVLGLAAELKKAADNQVADSQMQQNAIEGGIEPRGRDRVLFVMLVFNAMMASFSSAMAFARFFDTLGSSESSDSDAAGKTCDYLGEGKAYGIRAFWSIMVVCAGLYGLAQLNKFLYAKHNSQDSMEVWCTILTIKGWQGKIAKNLILTTTLVTKALAFCMISFWFQGKTFNAMLQNGATHTTEWSPQEGSDHLVACQSTGEAAVEGLCWLFSLNAFAVLLLTEAGKAERQFARFFEKEARATYSKLVYCNQCPILYVLLALAETGIGNVYTAVKVLPRVIGGGSSTFNDLSAFLQLLVVLCAICDASVHLAFTYAPKEHNFGAVVEDNQEQQPLIQSAGRRAGWVGYVRSFFSPPSTDSASPESQELSAGTPRALLESTC